MPSWSSVQPSETLKILNLKVQEEAKKTIVAFHLLLSNW